MSTALQVTINEVRGTLKFSRRLYLGSEYDVTFVGPEAGELPTIIMYDCQGNALVQSSVVDGAVSLKLNTLLLAALYDSGDSPRPKALHVYVYLDSVILGAAQVVCYYSPISFEYGDPVDIQGIKELWDDHILDTTNPHSVTLAQVGAAASAHNHDMSSLIVNGPGGTEYRMIFEYVDAQLTFYFEEET